MANYPPYAMPQGYQHMYQQGYQAQACLPTQTVNQPQPQAQGLNGRMVTSREEALGVPVDFMGGLMVFPDVGHGAVYTKVFNAQTGQAEFAEYRRVARPEPRAEGPAEAYALDSDVKALQAKVDELTNRLAAIQLRRRAQKEAAENE